MLHRLDAICLSFCAMDDIIAFAPVRRAPLTLDDYRLLRLIARSGEALGRLPLRYTLRSAPVDALLVRGLVECGDSGWPNVIGFRITLDGQRALATWLGLQRAERRLKSRAVPQANAGSVNASGSVIRKRREIAELYQI